MEMDMQEPGEMCCCCEEEHDLAELEITLQSKARPHAALSRIIISCRGIN
jgi:hypothetical protein